METEVCLIHFMKPDMMSAVATTGELKFRDTCTVVSKLLDITLPKLKKRRCCFFGRESNKEMETLQIQACETILSLNREDGPAVKDTFVSLLLNASALAKHLKALPSEKKWLILSRVWVELLSYAATHIRSSAYAPQLYKGRELITVVWLLMANLGLGDLFEFNVMTEVDS
ncbi:hypothetical protein POM88_020016 [Heracleum sosnowskyi]|uniref:Uncharacterized protein n=1 Tax=Heracleum sosnowskyi TaxID=360622 RepID=A0AAD8IB28_9APIA|nr:hypothetical protein POM88_020016 [Heracleum sosnowskyi]